MLRPFTSSSVRARSWGTERQADRSFSLLLSTILSVFCFRRFENHTVFSFWRILSEWRCCQDSYHSQPQHAVGEWVLCELPDFQNFSVMHSILVINMGTSSVQAYSREARATPTKESRVLYSICPQHPSHGHSYPTDSLALLAQALYSNRVLHRRGSALFPCPCVSTSRVNRGVSQILTLHPPVAPSFYLWSLRWD